jgi:drug/metabolite transporter (DMT)-like permease
VANSKVFWAFLGVAGMWGSSFLFIKLGLLELQPLTLVAIRTGFATLALAAILPFTGCKLPKDRRTLRLLLIAGVLNPAIPYLLITWGQQFVDSALGGIINATVPLFTLPLAHFTLRDERFTPARLGGLIVGFSGILLIFSQDQTPVTGGLARMAANNSALFGELAMTAAAICYAGSMVFVRRKLRDTAPEIVAGASQGIAFLLTMISALVLEAPLSNRISGPTWLVVAGLGINSGISYILFYFVLSKWGTTRTSLVTYLVPVIAVLLGAIFLREVISWQALTGGLLVISGIVIINRQAQLRPAHSAQ